MGDKYGPEILYHVVEELKAHKRKNDDLEKRVRANEKEIAVILTKLVLASVAVSAAISGVVGIIVSRLMGGP